MLEDVHTAPVNLTVQLVKKTATPLFPIQLFINLR